MQTGCEREPDRWCKLTNWNLRNTDPLHSTLRQLLLKSSETRSHPLKLFPSHFSIISYFQNSQNLPLLFPFQSGCCLADETERQQSHTLEKDWLTGKKIIIVNLLKCQAGFRTLCLFCQTICSNLISITEPCSTWEFLLLLFFFFPCVCVFQSVYLK